MRQVPETNENSTVMHRTSPAAAEGPRPAAQCARHLSLLNAVLMISLEDLSLERQLLRVLDLLLGVPWFPLRPQGAVFLVGDCPDVLIMAASRGFSAEASKTCAQVPFGHCVCGRAAALREPVVVECLGADVSECGQDMPAHGHYCIPLIQNSRVLGVLALYLKEGHRHDPEEAEFLCAVANTLAGIVAHSQGTERVRRLLDENRQLNRRLIALQEEEYRRLARELHDQIGQSITAIKTEAVLMPQARSAGELQRGVQAIGAEADRIYETMHETVRRLRPGALDDLGLVAALKAYIAEWQRRRPILACRFDPAGPFDDLDAQLKITVYRIVQECLTNIMRHAAATEVVITLARVPEAGDERTRGSVLLVVHDNGRGTEVTKLRERTGRFGLVGMRERVEGFGGTLSIESNPGRGFVLTATIPVPERRKDKEHGNTRNPRG